MPENVTPHPVRLVLYVDDSTHWHSTARLVGQFLRTNDGQALITTSLLLPGARQRAMEKAKEILGLPPERVTLLGRPGIVEHTLPDIARQNRADIVVVGRLGSVDRLTNGLIAHLIVKRTRTSVLIARGEPRAIRKILVCTEGSGAATKNIDRAALVAKAFGARLDLLHVVSQMGITDTARERVEADLRDFIHSDAPGAQHLRESKERIAAYGLQGDILVRTGLVVDGIVDAVREGGHDLLVIGAHDKQAPDSHLYEDLASLILRASPVSTLVVRAKPTTED